MSTLKEYLRTNPFLKTFSIWLITAHDSARPRLWIRLLVNPFIHTMGRKVRIRRTVRKDLFPFNEFVIGDHSFVEDFSTLNNGVGDVIIGYNTRVGLGCTIIGPVSIGNQVHLAQNIVVSGLNHNYKNVHKTIREQGVSTSPIVIEDDVWIGANSVVTAGVTIGTHSVVAAGSVVTKSIPPYSVWAGTPAKPIKQYNHKTGNWERLR